MTKELRVHRGAMTLRAAGEGANSPGTVEGYAALFNSKSFDLGGFVEIIAPGAFAESLRNDAENIMALWNHEDESPLGRLGVNLALREDDKGLFASLDLPNTSAARDAAELVGGNIVQGWSFGFSCTYDDCDWAYDEAAGVTLRTLKKVRLYEVSPVTFPAYPETKIGLRHVQQFQQFRAGAAPSANRADAQRAAMTRRLMSARLAAVPGA